MCSSNSATEVSASRLIYTPTCFRGMIGMWSAALMTHKGRSRKTGTLGLNPQPSRNLNQTRYEVLVQKLLKA